MVKNDQGSAPKPDLPESNQSAGSAKMPLRDGRSAMPGASASSEKRPDNRGGNAPDLKHTSVDTNAG